ncbi:hypothetical protein NDU88_006884 [Pleurodeles waltl]|uniref:Uncharacterized protein n=1 Tax=Pleurodeles waltl TaxID=8319 RepID=A0AAV7RTA4_PLEWA|nr:hypothetical protein NDU88_006884 [Pleurodeles waltl]
MPAACSAPDALLRVHVGGWERGSLTEAAVSGCAQQGDKRISVHAFQEPERKGKKALSACDVLAGDWSQSGTLEESTRGAPVKIAVPIVFDDTIVISDAGDEEGVGQHF